MVPKKHLSKRMSCSKRYKITKNAAEKHRKERKAAKKNPTTNKLKKDPGIPSIQTTLQDIANSAIERSKQFDQNKSTTESQEDDTIEADGAITGNKDNSRRAYYREFMKVAKASDVILFVLDSRDPLGTRSKQIETLITEKFNKKLVFVLNKTDLVPKHVLLQWLSYLRKERPTILFKANTQQQRTNLGSASFGAVGGTTECVGGESLLQLLKNYCRNLNIKTAITVGVIGFPNVGKSSIINSLKRARVCGVGSTPGFTKSVQLVHLDKTIRLLDSPGVVFNFTLNRNTKSNAEQNEICLRNIVKVELLTNPVGPAEVVINRCNKDVLAQRYNVLPFENSTEFLVQLARTRGRFRRGGIPDLQSAARIILTDWNTGKIPYYTTVPIAFRDSQDSSSKQKEIEIVSGWGKEFDLEKLFEFDQQVVDSLSAGTPNTNDKINPESKKRKSLSQDSTPHVSVSIGKELKMIGVDLEMDDESTNSDISDLSDIEDDASVSDEEMVEPEIKEADTNIVINIKNIENKAEKRRKVLKDPETDPEESLLNPQTNKQTKKNLKRQAKKEKKKKLLELSSTFINDSTIDEDVSDTSDLAPTSKADSSDEEL
ncbi:hypothetical protein BB561_001078 [Smittium simulii]|uniref:CP-type G domain-containing protein n=1 Tax=Smittium simulii TaxID=133385 RepID=A0A2T9YWA5_9FUNG|nr:hypothetical protein BB561_001078 [Smittium simulii]